MTWQEIKEALEKGKKTIIVPIGSIEQHGPHLPEGTDTYTGDILGEKIARKLGDTLVAPTIRPGCSRHHIEFPGTITLTPETLMRTIKEVCASLAHHGFKNIVLMPTHGGNFAPVNAVAPEIARKLKVNLVVIADLKELIETMAKAMQDFQVTPAQAGAHSGAAETSLMLACYENLVRKDLIQTGHLGEYTTPTILSKGIKAYSPIGVLGDPKKATKEAGEKIVNQLVETYVQKIKKQLGKK
jgi:creatinine amidohydrolase